MVDHKSAPAYLGPRALRARNYLEAPVIVAALLVIPTIVIEANADTGFWLNVAVVLNWIIWLVFMVDLVLMWSLVEDRRAWFKKIGWLDLFIVVTSFPLLTSSGIARLLRLWRIGPALRLLRLARLAVVVTRGGYALRNLFVRKGLGYIVGLTVMVAAGFGVFLSIVEPGIGTPWDGIWWAFVTATTVGYGDIAPDSAGGRAVAVVLMLLGIGLVGVFTGLVAAYFVEGDEEDEEDLMEDVRRLHERLYAIENALGIEPSETTKPTEHAISVEP